MQKTLKFWILGILFALSYLVAVDALAFQRMGIRAGSTVSIPSRGSGELEAFCLDEHDAPPTRGDDFTRLLNTTSPKAIPKFRD
jgi:hypothetical protein